MKVWRRPESSCRCLGGGTQQARSSSALAGACRWPHGDPPGIPPSLDGPRRAKKVARSDLTICGNAWLPRGAGEEGSRPDGRETRNRAGYRGSNLQNTFCGRTREGTCQENGPEQGKVRDCSLPLEETLCRAGGYRGGWGGVSNSPGGAQSWGLASASSAVIMGKREGPKEEVLPTL